MTGEGTTDAPSTVTVLPLQREPPIPMSMIHWSLQRELIQFRLQREPIQFRLQREPIMTTTTNPSNPLLTLASSMTRKSFPSLFRHL